MTIRSISNSDPLLETGQTAETAPAQTAEDPYAAILNPTQAISDMQLLFAGRRSVQRLREENPFQISDIPELQSDLLGPMPVLGSTPRDLQTIISRYRNLRINLIERRQNYSHALETGYLRPEETLDIYDRIEQIDSAILKIDHQLDQAITKRRQVEVLERQRELENLRAEEREENGD